MVTENQMNKAEKKMEKKKTKTLLVNWIGFVSI